MTENTVKDHFDKLNEVQRKYAEKNISIGNQQNNFFRNLMKNIVNKNEEEVLKDQKIKKTLLVCLSNCLKLTKSSESVKNITIKKQFDDKHMEDIDYLKNKYKEFFEDFSSKNMGEENLTQVFSK
jgi:hypothetical protein